jgi:hyperosmotically inducible protein
MTSNDEPQQAPASRDTLSAVTADMTADAQQVPAGVSATSGGPVPSDSRITADVKSEIASAAPDSNVAVTTTNGVVALIGSVPSQDTVERATHAAQRVAGVKDVDASELRVSDPSR